MPPVARFTIALAAGLWIGRIVVVPWPALAGAAVAVAWLLRVTPWRGVLAAAVLVGAVQGVTQAGRERAGCARRWAPGRHSAIVRLGDAPGSRGLADARVRYAPEGCGGTLRLRLAPSRVRSGETLVVVGTHTLGGAFRVTHVRVLGQRRPFRFVVRDLVAQRIATLYGPRAPIVEALVLGRRGSIDPVLRADFVASGLAHLLAISGLHVGIVAAWLALVARALGLHTRAGWLGAIGTWLYVALLGFPAPATRAAGFVAIQALARVRQRHPTTGAVLAVAVLVVLALDPAAVGQVGAWLSVAAVWGTSQAALVLRRLGLRRRAWLRLLAASVGAVLATAPVSAFAFGQVAPVGVITNLVGVPLAGFVVPAVFGSLVVGSTLAAGAGVLLLALERLAALGGAIPFGRVAGDPGVAFAMPWCLLLVAVLWLVRRRPTWRVARLRIGAAVAVVVWLAALQAWWIRDSYDGLSIYVLNVGQGDAIVLRSPHGHWALMDGGPRMGPVDAGRDVVAPFLRRRGVRSLDFLILSHGDADHSGGVPSVVDRVPPALVLEPGQPLGTPPYAEFLAAVDRSGAEWRAARRGDVITWDGVRVEVLHPTSVWMRHELRPNENCVVVRVSYGAFDALLTGDAGMPVESLLVDAVRQVEVLKVGHHGSAGASGGSWLDAVGPRVAVISVGAKNRYGHPAPAVLARLDRRGIDVYRTDREGTVTVRSDGQYFVVLRGSPNLLTTRLPCLVRAWLPSRASSSNRSGCFPRQPGSSRTSYTTWPSPPR